MTGTVVGASNADGQWGENGVTILQTDAAGDLVLNLSEKNLLQIRLQGKDGAGAQGPPTTMARRPPRARGGAWNSSAACGTYATT